MAESAELKRFQEINHKWLTSLKYYSEEELSLSPSKEEWTLGKLYIHLFMINEAVLKNLNSLIEGNGIVITQKKPFAVRLIFLLNSLPPIKLKIPSVVNPPFQPESKKEIEEKFKTVEERIIEIIPKVLEMDKNRKLKHPRMGFLNAREWLAFINIHMKHHLRQKRKLDKWLKMGGKQNA